MEALLTIVPSQRALFDWRRRHADAGHASLTFEISIITRRRIHVLWLNGTSSISGQKFLTMTSTPVTINGLYTRPL